MIHTHIHTSCRVHIVLKKSSSYNLIHETAYETSVTIDQLVNLLPTKSGLRSLHTNRIDAKLDTKPDKTTIFFYTSFFFSYLPTDMFFLEKKMLLVGWMNIRYTNNKTVFVIITKSCELGLICYLKFLCNIFLCQLQMASKDVNCYFFLHIKALWEKMHWTQDRN